MMNKEEIEKELEIIKNDIASMSQIILDMLKREAADIIKEK